MNVADPIKELCFDKLAVRHLDNDGEVITDALA
jgi:hypothetical protein